MAQVTTHGLLTNSVHASVERSVARGRIFLTETFMIASLSAEESDSQVNASVHNNHTRVPVVEQGFISSGASSIPVGYYMLSRPPTPIGFVSMTVFDTAK